MTRVSVEGHLLDIDVHEVLAEYTWNHASWRAEKLIAASPFRDDSHPSFFVNLTNGAWGDSGAYDENYTSGNLAKLLSFLRNETYEETLDYLIDMYGVRDLREGERITLPKVTVSTQKERLTLDETFLDRYRYRNPYLGNRGISEVVQRYMGIGYSKKDKAVTMPWRHADGTLANVKYRQIFGKTFWYAKGAAPIGDLVYGIDKIYARDIKMAVICEAEIDALSWMTCGVPAIAVGRSSIRETQLDIIRRSPLEKVFKVMDNDGPGEKLGRELDEGLHRYMTVIDVYIPEQYKDSNEVLTKHGESSLRLCLGE